ncbi:hypothetical protein [Streptomyces sp. NBC_01264]|uniref:hypothetical protein n=1 Tax=Streptomyces sp. NBC_01264 TaxID=2903804 RepID=UPI002259EFC5|nr:hypothetical protein [Streptomyces sp. NBC_01264]MCX4775332.1 hypothetical protein [Streptomyces sp. NBC_01264]
MKSIIATGIATTAIGAAALMLPGAAPAFAAGPTIHNLTAPAINNVTAPGIHNATAPTTGGTTADGDSGSGTATDGGSTDPGIPGGTGKVQFKSTALGRKNILTPDNINISGTCPSGTDTVASITSAAFDGPATITTNAGSGFEATAKVKSGLTPGEQSVTVTCTAASQVPGAPPVSEAFQSTFNVALPYTPPVDPGTIQFKSTALGRKQILTPDSLNISGTCPSNANAVTSITSNAFANPDGPPPGKATITTADASGFRATAEVLPNLAPRTYPVTVTCSVPSTTSNGNPTSETFTGSLSVALPYSPPTPTPTPTSTPTPPPTPVTPYIPKGAPDTGVVTGGGHQSPLEETGEGLGVAAAIGAAGLLGRRWLRVHQR